MFWNCLRCAMSVLATIMQTETIRGIVSWASGRARRQISPKNFKMMSVSCAKNCEIDLFLSAMCCFVSCILVNSWVTGTCRIEPVLKCVNPVCVLTNFTISYCLLLYATVCYWCIQFSVLSFILLYAYLQYFTLLWYFTVFHCTAQHDTECWYSFRITLPRIREIMFVTCVKQIENQCMKRMT